MLHPTPAPLVKPIEWGDEQDLTAECPYPHFVGASPLGTFTVSMVPLGDRLAYDLYSSPLPGTGISVLDAVGIVEAFEEVQALYTRRIKACLNL